MAIYDNLKTRSAVPEATAMIESFRAIGYSLESAVSDVIDNSVSAGAENIWVDYKWDGENTIVCITDDGCGMTEEEIAEAMKPGCKNPLEDRVETDLGRFGLGLKTAAFSQCRKFCVASKNSESNIDYWAWDLDYVNAVSSWTLIRYLPETELTGKTLEHLRSLKSGTSVIWWDIDRLASKTCVNNPKDHYKFMQDMGSLSYYIATVFHRFIQKGLKIFVQDRAIEAWDPFMPGIDGLQGQPVVNLAGTSVRIKGYILPHRSLLTPEQYKHGQGMKGSWTAHQGFYLYRNNRLIVAGDWLGMFKRETHYDLCRISIDITNELDHDWQIDIRKSIARPPAVLTDSIRAAANNARSIAVEVFRHKGQEIRRKFNDNSFIVVWLERVKEGKRFYEINRRHPMIEHLSGACSDLKVLNHALRVIEETVPVPLMVLRESENDTYQAQPFETSETGVVLDIMKTMLINLLRTGYEKERAIARIMSVEPFDRFTHLISQLEEKC